MPTNLITAAAIQPPFWLRWIYPEAVWRFSTREKSVLLTFDDGPTPGFTEYLLDTLDSFGAKAVFFCLGKNVQAHPNLFDEIIRRGHLVGNHTWDHPRGTRTANSEYFNSIGKASEVIPGKLFRPPYGRMKLSQYLHLKKQYQIVLWDVLTMDYDACLSPEDCISIIKKYSRSGSVLVFHDSIKARLNLLNVLTPALQWLKDEGFSFANPEVLRAKF